ncbi:MAG: ADOP family duplicated permease [Chthoniobacterales bacterium]
MRILSLLVALGRNLFGNKKVERDLAEEVDSYLALSTDAKVRAGLDETAARREAAVELGGVEQVKEEVRDVRLGHFLETRLQDLRFAFHTLRKSPVFSLTVVLVLAIGIGSTVLMFALVNSLLLRGPAFPEAERLYMLWQKIPQEDRVSFSPNEFTVWEKQSEVFQEMAAFTGTSFTVSGRGEPDLVHGQMVTPSFFNLLRATPSHGRSFLAEEGTPGQDHAVILSHGLWRQKFGGRAEVLGEKVMMDGKPFTVVGVMPESFHFPDHTTKFWVPAALPGPVFQEHPDAHFLRILGRVKTGVSAERLQAEADTIGQRVTDPADKTERRFFAVGLKEMITGHLRSPLLVLLSAVGFLLLIACANVANLTLARTHARRGEMALRAALGASRPRLVAQLLTEAGVLAAIGGTFGLLLAHWGLGLLQRFANVPELLGAKIDGSALGFVVLASAFCGLLCGLGPAWSGSRITFRTSLSGSTRSTTGATGARHALVFTEVALAAVLLIGCALMMRTFVRLIQVNPGFRPADVVTADALMSEDRYPGKPQMLAFYRSSLATVRSLPGVQSAAMITHLPFGGNDWGNGYEIEGQSARDENAVAQIRPVSPGYFSTLRIPLKSGNDFSERDSENAAGVAIVSELLARRSWPNDKAVGKKIRYGDDWLTVIGVCGDIKHGTLDESSVSTIYLPYPQVPAGIAQFVARDLNFVVRSSSPGAVAGGVRGAIRTLDPGMVVNVNTLEALIHDSVTQPRFRTWLIGIFSILALSLACLGIYGVIAYLVTQRDKEIGIRLALGATRANILGLVLGRTFQLALAGIAAGLLAAFFLARFLDTILFGITAHDPLTFVLVPLGLIAIALLAGYLPARRATRVDPVTSLRYE